MNENDRGEKETAELYGALSSGFNDYHAKRGDIEFFQGYTLESGGLYAGSIVR